MRKINTCMIAVVISLLCSQPLFADGPYETYHVAIDDISKDVLKNSIGILTINAGIKKGMELKTFVRDEEQFTYVKNLKVRGETTPISNFGLRPPIDTSYISNYRYPIVGKVNHYLCIVYDPKRNIKAWVNKNAIEENFSGVSVIIIDSLKTPSSFFVDIFYFTKSGRRKLYQESKNDADFIVISKDEHKYSLLRIIEQKNGFVRIGIAYVDYSAGQESIEPIGWIRIRNNQGMLMIWVKYVDLY